jgi:hypothetical protein
VQVFTNPPQQLRGAVFDYRSRVLWAVILIVVIASLSNLALLRDIALFRKSGLAGVNVGNYEKRFEGLRAILPAHTVIGYQKSGDTENLDYENDDTYADLQQDYRLAQYALAPVILRPATDQLIHGVSFVIVDRRGGRFSSSQEPTKVDPPKGFILMRNFGNGLLLYRRESP